jgi:hypothetical protein
MKTSFLKESEVSQILNANDRKCDYNVHSGGRVIVNHEAGAYNSGTIRKVKGLDNIYIASCSLDFGGQQWVEVYDKRDLNVIAYLKSVRTLTELKNSEKAQEELKNINDNLICLENKGVV